jgi:hypothetical protein
MDSTMLDTDAWQRDRGRHPAPVTVGHRTHEWARDANGAGQGEAHGHTCAGGGAALRPYRRGFRGVHKPYLPLDVAADAAMVHAKQVTPLLSRRMCIGYVSGHTGDT